MPIFRRELELDVPQDELFAWHARSGALARLLPAFERARVRASTPAPDGSTIGAGARVHLELGLGPLALHWHAEHTACEPPHLFVDEQRRGPFAHWRHEHRFEALGAHRSRLVDSVDYALPLESLSGGLAGGTIERRLERTFRFRHAVTAGDIAAHAAARERLGHARPLTVLVAGASGLVGSQLAPFLTTGGHRVVRLVRGATRGPDEIAWNPRTGAIEARAFGPFDAVVNLSGANIAGARWTPARKRELVDSRVETTKALVDALRSRGSLPAVYVQASGVGAYDDQLFERDPSAIADESAPIASSFLGELCAAWEGAAAPLAALGVRCVFTRFGAVLDPRGGALGKMLPPFLVGAGGPVGSGRQPLPWVALDDALGAILFALTDSGLSGPVNTVAPEHTTQAEFARVLGRVLRRPAFAPLPAPAVRLVFGELGEALLLRGARVEPRALARRGFHFRYPGLEGSLRHLLGR
jgi:hypothetical protein